MNNKINTINNKNTINTNIKKKSKQILIYFKRQNIFKREIKKINRNK